MKRISWVVAILTALLPATTPVLAQTETPPEARSWTGVVNGVVVNRSAGGEKPGALELMVHAWDENLTERLMLHGQSASDGSFQFGEVTFDPTLLYAVMLTYEDVVYYSPLARVEAGQATLDLEVPVYESTTDTTAVVVERMHVFFDAAPGGVQVAEVYVLSNLGDRTVAGGVALEGGRPAALEFPLPEDAIDVSFDAPERYVRTAKGFADTQALAPGNGTGQAVVTYTLPYADGMTYAKTAVYPTAGVSLLVPSGSGISISGTGLSAAGAREMSQGVRVDVFTHAGLEPGEAVSVTLSGEPTAGAGRQATGMQPAAQRGSSSFALAFGGAVLGLALLVVGAWWYRRPESAAEDSPADAEFDELVAEIAALDAARARGDLDGAGFTTQRAALVQRAKEALSDEEAP